MKGSYHSGHIVNGEIVLYICDELGPEPRRGHDLHQQEAHKREKENRTVRKESETNG